VSPLIWYMVCSDRTRGSKISHALLTCQEFGHDGEAIGVREHSVHEFFANAVCSEPATRERDINYISL